MSLNDSEIIFILNVLMNKSVSIDYRDKSSIKSHYKVLNDKQTSFND